MVVELVTDYAPMFADDILTLKGKTIKEVVVHTDDTNDIDWVSFDFTDGTEVEIHAHGLHTEGWVEMESGHRIREIYKKYTP